jgi:hypothetical protein
MAMTDLERGLLRAVLTDCGMAAADLDRAMRRIEPRLDGLLRGAFEAGRRNVASGVLRRMGLEEFAPCLQTAAPPAEPLAESWTGVRTSAKIVQPSPLEADDVNRCAVCGWLLAGSRELGCVRGICARFLGDWPPPTAYAPVRAFRERESLAGSAAKAVAPEDPDAYMTGGRG